MGGKIMQMQSVSYILDDFLVGLYDFFINLAPETLNCCFEFIILRSVMMSHIPAVCRKTVLACFLLCCTVVLLAQSSSTADMILSPYEVSITFSNLSKSNGLSSNTVRALLQDKNGFVWMGTSRGLNRYDGWRMQQITGTRSMSISALAECGDTIWVGTDHGLFLYLQRADSVQRYMQNMQILSQEGLNVTDMKKDPHGFLWVATMGQGIFQIDTKSGISQDVKAPAQGSVYECLYVDKDGDVWASSNVGNVNLVRYNAARKCFEEYPLYEGTSDTPFFAPCVALTEDMAGKMWLGGWNGDLIRFDKVTHRAEVLFTSVETQMRHVHSIMELKEGYLLVGSDEGLAVVDVPGMRVKRHHRGTRPTGMISDNFVYPMIQDRERGTWIGTYYGGVNYTHPTISDFTSIVEQQILDMGGQRSVLGNVINHFCEDSRHRLWIASDDGGLCYYDSSAHAFTPVRLSSNGVESNNVHALNMVGDLLYVGTYSQGLYMVNVNTMAVTHVPTIDAADGTPLDVTSYAIFTDRQQHVWVGTCQEVGIYHPETRTLSDVQKTEKPVLDIQQDHVGGVWVATNGNGLWLYGKNRKWKHYGGRSGTFVTAYSLCEDTRGTLWVGMESGLYRYLRHEDRFEKVLLVMDDICVYGVTAEDENLWLTTSAGILCYSLQQNKVVQVYKGGGNIVSTDFLPNAIYRDSGGRIYMGTTNGFITFHPQQMHHGSIKPRVVFTGVDVFNRPVAVGGEILPERLPYLKELHLSYRESVFRIHFSAMSYMKPSDVLYSYYLEGFDKTPTSGNQASVTYTNLAPGTYTLHVRATTSDGMQSDDATLRIIITPPFYWNTPAKTLYLLLIIAVITLLVHHLLKKKERKHEEEMQKLNIQKEHEIQELNTQREQEVHDARIKFMTINEKDQAFLEKMEAIIERSFSNPDLSVDYLASELGVSRSGLFAKTKTLADITPNEMIQVIRLKHAASLLVTGNYRVNEVCYMAGFSSPSYFAKCFYKQYGCTPAKYKG